MIKKFESFHPINKNLGDRMGDLMTLRDIFADIEDGCVNSEHYYIGPEIRREVMYYRIEGKPSPSHNVDFNDGFRIDLTFKWESEEDFHRILIDIVKHIQRSKVDGFEFLYETRKLYSNSHIDIGGVDFFFEDIFKEFITIKGKMIKPVDFGEEPGDEMFMSHGEEYIVMLFFKKP